MQAVLGQSFYKLAGLSCRCTTLLYCRTVDSIIAVILLTCYEHLGVDSPRVKAVDSHALGFHVLCQVTGKHHASQFGQRVAVMTAEALLLQQEYFP